MKSSMQNLEKDGCYICGSYSGIQRHHCIGGSGRRKKSDKYGLIVNICFNHHGGDQDIHKIRTDLLKEIRESAQKSFETTHTREFFRKEFGISFL